MLSLYDTPSIEAALAAPMKADLRKLLTDRIDDAAATGLLELSHFLVIQAGDREQDIADEICLTPLTNPIDGERFGSPAFNPFWDWLEDHGGWFEMIVTVGNSGFAFVLLIEDSEDVPPELRALCRKYAEPARCAG
jgi:hypothetical protein